VLSVDEVLGGLFRSVEIAGREVTVNLLERVMLLFGADVVRSNEEVNAMGPVGEVEDGFSQGGVDGALVYELG
jgi:hypothetical protein